MSAVDEFVPLLFREQGAPVVWLGLLLLIPAAAMALSAAVADRFGGLTPARAATLTAPAGVLLAAGALVGHPIAGALLLAACAIPILALAALMRRWLPTPTPC